MKNLFIFSFIFIQSSFGFSQVIPEKTLKEKNYQEVQLFKVDSGFSSIDKFAMYPNGQTGINEHIISSLKYPKKAQAEKIEGVVIVKYTVNVDGSIINLKVIKSAGTLLDKEAIRVIKKMEKWKPAYQGGKPVISTYTQLFNFKL